jgi:site-specific recombinase XerD
VITSPELIAQFNPENIKLVDRFLKEKNTRCSDGTIIGYKSDLEFSLLELIINDNKFFIDLKKIELADFFSYCVDELKWGSNRFSRMRSALSSLSKFIEKFYDEKYPDYRGTIVLNAIELMPKNPVRKKTILSEDQVNSLLKYLKEDRVKPQEACLFALLASSGVRISEALRFTTTIIEENNTAFDDMFLETIEEIKTKGFGKTGKMLIKYIIKDIFLPYYKDWLIEREKIMQKNGQEHDFIFIKRDGTPAKVNTIRGWVTKWEKFLGVPYYPHCTRHYTVTYLTRLGLDSTLLLKLGWSSK